MKGIGFQLTKRQAKEFAELEKAVMESKEPCAIFGQVFVWGSGIMTFGANLFTGDKALELQKIIEGKR